MVPYDEEDPLALAEAARKFDLEQAKLAGASEVQGQRIRSTADDILDAVSNTPTKPSIPATHCPVCGGPSKVRGAGVGNNTMRRRCLSKDCRNEWPVGQRINRVETPPVPPQPGSMGPFHGEGGPPIDHNQPVHRRLAEHIRRARDHEP